MVLLLENGTVTTGVASLSVDGPVAIVDTAGFTIINIIVKQEKKEIFLSAPGAVLGVLLGGGVFSPRHVPRGLQCVYGVQLLGYCVLDVCAEMQR